MQKKTLRSGRNSLAYLGVEPSSPINYVTDTRDPNVNDINGFHVGDEWENRLTRDVFKLVSVDLGVATWVLMTAAAGVVTNLRPTLGPVVVPDVTHAINVIGGHNIYTTSAAAPNTINIHLDDRTAANGQLLIGAGAGNPAVWANITDGVGIHTTPGAGTLLIDCTVNTATNLIDNAGLVVAPDATHGITIAAGDNITTVGNAGAHSITVSLAPNATDGQLLTGSTGGPAVWRVLNAGAGITIDWDLPLFPDQITISAPGAAGNITLTADVDDATSVAGILEVYGGANINTEGDTAHTFTINLNDSIVLPNTTGAAVGTYVLGGTIFISNWNSNVFLGGAGNLATTGVNNTMVGDTAGAALAAAADANTALGAGALSGVTTGSFNVGLGEDAGSLLTTEDSNIMIQNLGVVGDSHTLRIGDPLVPDQSLTSTYIDGIYQEPVAAGYEFALVDAVAKLGTINLADLKFFVKVGYITKIAVGALHACILTSEGTVYCVGDNQYGQLGNNTTTDAVIWTRMLGQGTGGVTDIACGAYHTVIVKSGVGYSCGLNANSQLGTNNTTNYSIPTAMTGPGTAGITAVSAGNAHTSVIIGAALYSTGLNSEGQLGDNTTTQRAQLTAAAAPANAGVTALACGAYHTVILKTDAMFACGRGVEGQLGDNTATQRNLMTAAVAPGDAGVTAISAGQYHTAVLKTDAVFACGKGSAGALGDNTATQRDLLTAAVAPANAGVTSLSCGQNHTSLLKGAVGYGCGLNTDGSIGDNTVVQRNLATAMTSEGTSGLGLIASGNMANTTYATKNGIMFACGDNSNGQISDGTLVDRHELTRSVV